jgi:hypothetical protein
LAEVDSPSPASGNVAAAADLVNGIASAADAHGNAGSNHGKFLMYPVRSTRKQAGPIAHFQALIYGSDSFFGGYVRYAPLLVWFGSGLTLFSCDSGSQTASPCPAEKEPCGSSCVSVGACTINHAGGSSNATGGAPTIDTGPITSADCTDSATASGVLATQYPKLPISTTDGNKEYALMGNWWWVYDGQTISYQGLSFTIGNPNHAASPDNNPIGFPTMFIGAYQGIDTLGSNLPKQVSALTTVPTVFGTNAAEGKRDDYNATYDVWFTPDGNKLTSGASSPPKGGAYLMVWLFKPSNRRPRGSVWYAGHTVNGVDGAWDVWIDGAPTDPLCISYVSVNPLDGLAFDLNNFIQDAVTNKYGIKSSMYLSIVFAGFEIWSGGEGLQVKNYCAKVN